MEPKESIKEGKDKSAIMRVFKRRGIWKSGRLVFYSLGKLRMGLERYISN